MSIRELKDRIKDVLAAGIVRVSPFSYIEEENLDEYVSKEKLEELIQRMQEKNLEETIAVGRNHTLFILKIGDDHYLTCVAPSSRPFGYCRKVLHQMAQELD